MSSLLIFKINKKENSRIEYQYVNVQKSVLKINKKSELNYVHNNQIIGKNSVKQVRKIYAVTHYEKYCMYYKFCFFDTKKCS